MLKSTVTGGRVLLASLLLLLAGLARAQEPPGLIDPTRATPPVVDQRPVEMVMHEDVFVDSYAWLRDLEDPEVLALLEAENDYTDAVLAPLQALEDTLYDEMIGRIAESNSGFPSRYGDYWYYWSVEPGEDRWNLLRAAGSPDGPVETVIDLNALAAGEDYFDVAAWAVTRDGRWLAYLTDASGGIEYSLVVVDLETGETIGEPIDRVNDMAFRPDGGSIFYVAVDDSLRGYEVREHVPGSGEPDKVIYTEESPEFSVGVGVSHDERLMIIYSSASLTSEAYIYDPYDPEAEPMVLLPRREGILYGASVAGGLVYMRINDVGPNYRIVTIPLADHLAGGGEEIWRTLVPHRDDVVIRSFGLHSTFLDLSVRRNGQTQLDILDLATLETRTIEFPDATYTVYATSNDVYDTETYHFGYESPTRPSSIFAYDLRSGESEVVWQEPVPGDHDPSRYETRRLFATAEDGTQVPISLVFAQGTPLDGSAPLLLEAYGAYGSTYDPFFDLTVLSLLDRGVVYAFAHVRGGGAFGLSWYEGGRMAEKMNTFTDVIAVAEHLQAEGYSSADRMVLTGTSAGGLTVGAVLNLRPDLFAGAVLNVPFVDILTVMLDPSLPLTTLEYTEWGNPEIPEQYGWMQEYDPYRNLGPQDYPPMLIVGALNDDQVPVWQPAKYAARVRSLVPEDTAVLLSVNMGAGHGGDPGRFEGYRLWAFQYAFVLGLVGIAE